MQEAVEAGVCAPTAVSFSILLVGLLGFVVRSVVFLPCSPGVLGYVEDTWAKMQASALKLQAYMRMHFARSRYDNVRSAVLLFQSSWRAREQRLVFGRAIREHKAAVTIQRHYKGYLAQRQYKKVGTLNMMQVHAAYFCKVLGVVLTAGWGSACSVIGEQLTYAGVLTS